MFVQNCDLCVNSSTNLLYTVHFLHFSSSFRGSAEATRQAAQLITALIKEPDKDIAELMAKLKKANNSAQSSSTANSINISQSSNSSSNTSSSSNNTSSSQSQKSVPPSSSVAPRFKNVVSAPPSTSNIISKPPPSQATISQYLPRTLAGSTNPPRAPISLPTAQNHPLPRTSGANMRWGAPQVKLPTTVLAPTQPPEVTKFQAPVAVKQPSVQPNLPSPSAMTYQQPAPTQEVTPSKSVARCLFKPPVSQEVIIPSKPVGVPLKSNNSSQDTVFQNPQSSSLFSNPTTTNMIQEAMEKPRSMQQHTQEMMYGTAPVGSMSKPVAVESAQAFAPDSPSQSNMGTMPMNDSAALGFMNPDHSSDLWNHTVGHHMTESKSEMMQANLLPTPPEESKAPGYKRLSAPPGSSHQPPIGNPLSRSHSHTFGGQGASSHPLYQHQVYSKSIHHFAPHDGPTLNPSSFAPQMPDMNNFAPISPENHTPTPPPNGSPVSPGASPRSGTTSPSQEKKIMMPIGTERHKQQHHRKTPVVFPATIGSDLGNPLSSTGVSSIWSYQSKEQSIPPLKPSVIVLRLDISHVFRIMRFLLRNIYPTTMFF